MNRLRCESPSCYWISVESEIEEGQGEQKNVACINACFPTKQTQSITSEPYHPTLYFGGSQEPGGDTRPLPTTRSHFF